MTEVLQDIINQVEKLEFKQDDVIVIKTDCSIKEFGELKNTLMNHAGKIFKNKVIVIPKNFEISVFGRIELIDWLKGNNESKKALQ